MRITISSENLHDAFIKRVEELSGQNIFSCYQCGKCSAGCPIASEMDILPNQVIRFLQLGMEEDVLSCKSIWLCASCFTCQSRCPKGVDLTKIMEALRLIILRTNVNHVEPSALTETQIEELPQIALICNFRKLTS